MVPFKRKWLTSEAFRITRFGVCALIGIALGCATVQPLFAQDKTRQNYESLLKEWKATYVEALVVWSEFRVCEESESGDLQRRYLELKKTGDELIEKTMLAAAECVESAITPDPELIVFLKDAPLYFYTASRYEDSARVGRALLKHDPENFSLLYNTARSAFFSNDFEYAGELFEKWIELDGELIPALQPMYDANEQLVADWKKELELREQDAIDDQLPRIVFETTKGPIVVELFEHQAPVIVNNLLALIENETNPFFDDLSFFFVLQHQFAVTGSATDDGTQVYALGYGSEEQKRVARGNFRGSVGLDVRDLGGGKTAVATGCRFVQIPMPELNGTNLVIGRVIEGMEVVDQLQPTHELNQVQDTVPVESAIPDRLVRVYVQRKPEGKVYKVIDTENAQNKN